jgi:hypothetical protein
MTYIHAKAFVYAILAITICLFSEETVVLKSGSSWSALFVVFCERVDWTYLPLASFTGPSALSAQLETLFCLSFNNSAARATGDVKSTVPTREIESFIMLQSLLGLGIEKYV